MTFKQFKEMNNGEARIGHRVIHPIYGAGNVLKLAQGRFAWVYFEKPRSSNMAVLAVSLGVCS